MGRFSLADLGLKGDDLLVKGGNLRIVIELGQLQGIHFYKMPLFEFSYLSNIHESEWVVEYNGQNVLEKKDHSGRSTVLLLKRQPITGRHPPSCQHFNIAW